jgi:hypothetical protein
MRTLQYLAALVLLWSSGCLNPCGNEILSETISPEKSTRAVVFERACGATSGDSTHVSILRANERLSNDAGNVFSADNNHEAFKVTVTVHWDSAQRLVIRYPARARIFRKETTAKGVALVYEPQ